MNRSPEKYEARALEYDRKNKPKKALKYREKAAKLRASHVQQGGGPHIGQAPLVNIGTNPAHVPGAPVLVAAPATYLPMRSVPIYEKQAVKWESRGNYNKAQKNREKAWRLNNPQYAGQQVPAFYNNNQFVGYNAPTTTTSYYTTTTTTVV
jgi:tetratricopeptide (TPR) repeat protein